MSAQTAAVVTGPLCSATPVKVVDLHADFRDIWKGTEVADTGKQTGVRPAVGLDFGTTVQPSLVAAQFVPVKTDGSCGPSVPGVLTASVLAPQVWGTVTTDVARGAVPSPFNVLVRDTISGIVSAGGPLAAGGDIVLSGVGVNGTAKQPVGLIAGGKVSLSNGSIFGDVTYGVASTIPATISVSGTKSLKPFSASAAFQDLASLASLLAQGPANGVAKTTNGLLQLTGTKTTLNVFQISADALAQATSLQISVPANAGTLINVTGNMTVAFQNKGLTLTGATAATMLWNVPSAAFVQISGIALSGSLLAPRALVTFDSGTFNGTLVAASFASSGSGTLIQAPLNVSKVFSSTSPSAVRLAPAQDLVQGCTYQFLVPDTVPFTASGACLSPAVTVTFRVAKGAVPPSGRELTNVEPDPVLHTFRRFTAKPGINTPVDDVWARYESSIGIAASALVPTTITAPSSTRTGQTVTAYQQYAQGYPVVGYGYFVAASGGIFRAANGKVMPGLPAFPPATVSAATALQSALTAAKITQAPWVTKPSVNHAPVGQLVVLPKRTFPRNASDFALVWSFRFGAGTGLFEPAGAKVDATTGAVLGLETGLQSFTPLNSGATFAGTDVVTSVDTVYDGAQPFNAALYKNPDTTQVAALATGDINGVSVLGTVTGVTEDASAAIVGTPQFIAHAASMPWTAADKVEQRMASLQWGLGLANKFLQNMNLRIGGVQWLNIDGPRAHQKVLINYTNGLPVVPGVPVIHYSGESSTPDAAQIFFYTDPSYFTVQAGAVAHEYTHALIDSLRRASGLGGAKGVGTLANYKEAGSLNEGIADLFAIAANRASKSTRSLPWYCLEVDKGSGPECIRNIKEPINSTTIPANPGAPPQPGLPSLYRDSVLGYHDYTADPITSCTPATDNCGTHWNSTVISHWGYILGLGAAPGDNTCALTVAPLDADPDKSLAMALKIALIAVSSRTALPTGGLRVEASFVDFRDATLQVTQELIDQGVVPPEALAKVELAWDAVGLPPLGSHSDVAAPVNVSGVYPWTTFKWPLSGDGQTGSSWDFQLTNGTFDSTLAFHQDAITGSDPNAPLAVLPLSLPYNSQKTFFWRVRPHSALPWEICYPVRSFTGTSVPDPVNNLHVTKELESVAGKVMPGRFDIGWDFVRGTQSPNAEFWIDTTNPACPAGAAPSKVEVAPVTSSDGTSQTSWVGFVLQPKTHYFANLRPVGPPDFTGAPAHGDCANLEFDTANLLPPETVASPGPRLFSDPWLQVFNWKTSGGAAKSLITLYAQDANGDCSDTPIGDPYEVATNCPGSCDMGFTTPSIPGPPNLTGYCWDVVDVGENGVKSPPSDKKHWTYRAIVLKPEPGYDWSATKIGISPGILPGDSYGKPVKFSWTTLPNYPSAPAYGLKIGRWFWPKTLSTPEPFNCVDGNTSLNLCNQGPVDAGYTTIVPGASSKQLTADQAGKGRYCWGVWPIFDYADHPEGDGVNQPNVGFELMCYTTGPALPRIPLDDGTNYSTDENVPPPRYTSATISGHVELDYVPDNQLKGRVLQDGVEIDTFDASSCEVDPNALGYLDYYDCKVPFSFTPAKNTTYELDIKTYNNPVRGPIKDTDTVVQHVVRKIITGTCGETDQQCCDDHTCADPAQACLDGTCVKCGELDGVCCADKKCAKGTTAATRLTCDGGNFCRKCGGPSQLCCSDISLVNNQEDGCEANNLALDKQACFNGTCQTCGKHDGLCCPESKGPFIPICENSGDKCIIGKCRTPEADADCVTPLVAAKLPKPPTDPTGVTDCQNIGDLNARMLCIMTAGSASDVCQYFFQPNYVRGFGWDAVKGADQYRVTVIGAFYYKEYYVAGASGHVQTFLPLTAVPFQTLGVCGFDGFGIAVTAINGCGVEGPVAFTGLGVTPP